MNKIACLIIASGIFAITNPLVALASEFDLGEFSQPQTQESSSPNTSAFASAGASGDRSHTSASTSTWQDFEYTPAHGNTDAPQFETSQGTVRTFKGNQGQFINAPSLPRTNLGIAAIGSGFNRNACGTAGSSGFRGGGSKLYTGPYKGGFGGGGVLPPTATSIVDLHITY
jgi:hypothetical protein